MAKNRIISSKTAEDIDNRIERVLRGIGYPDPPLRLRDVRELLKLDRTFYRTNDPGILHEVINRIRVAGIQVYKRPTLLIHAIRKLSLKALYLPDRRRILLDAALPEKKRRWNEVHEIGHSLIPWHKDMMLGDNNLTLSLDCREQIEAEANFAARRLLFLRDRFTHEVRSLEPSIDTVQKLHRAFGNTLSTTLYGVVETAGTMRPIVGMISSHPHVSRRPNTFDPTNPCRHFIQSPAFRRRFTGISEADLFAIVASYCGSQSGGPLGESELTLIDDNGDRHRFFFETFFNTYDALTLGKYLRPEIPTVVVQAEVA